MSLAIKALAILFLLLSQDVFSAIDPAQINKNKRVLILGLDGTTGNQFHQVVWKDNKAPVFRNLMSSGIFTYCETDHDPRCAKAHRGRRTGDGYLWLTGPGWASVLTGLDNGHHKVKDNQHDSLKQFASSTKDFPTFMRVAKASGLKTAAAGVSAFITSHKEDEVVNGIIDYECGALANGPNVNANAISSCNLDSRTSLNNKDGNRDVKLSDWFVSQIKNSDAHVIMGVFDKIDSAGHSYGFDSNSRYLKSISETDALIGKVVAAAKESAKNKNEEWLVIVTSDHGGHRLFAWGMHGARDDEDEAIPFAVSLIGSEQKLKPLRYPVTHMDVFPTVMHWLEINQKKRDGQIQGF